MDICDAEEIKKEIKEDIKPMPEEVSKLKYRYEIFRRKDKRIKIYR